MAKRYVYYVTYNEIWRNTLPRFGRLIFETPNHLDSVEQITFLQNEIEDYLGADNGISKDFHVNILAFSLMKEENSSQKPPLLKRIV